MRPDARAWFQHRTTSAGTLAEIDVDALLRDKRRGGHRISVVLPARNEEATVGHLVSALHEHWMRRLPLVDELLVVDSDSTDATAEVARAAGAEVVATAECCPPTAAGPARARRCGSRWPPPPATSSCSSTPTSSGTSPTTCPVSSGRC
ncbi:MAG TPA: glycosyltransferase [Blastococcus sp.]